MNQKNYVVNQLLSEKNQTQNILQKGADYITSLISKNQIIITENVI